MRFALLLLCWVLVPVQVLQAGERPMLLEEAASEALLHTGRAHLLAFRLAEAEQTFQRLSRTADGAAAAWHHLATTSLLKLILTSDRRMETEFFARSDSLKTALKAHPDSRWRAWLGAEANLQRALAEAKTGDYLQAVLAARLAYHELERIHHTWPGFVEAYKAQGLMQWAIGSLPSGYQRFLRLIGYRGHAGEGLRLLRLAADESTYGREEASALLAINDVVLNEARGEAVPRLRQLHHAHPKNPFIAYLYGYALFTDRQATEAEVVLRQVAQRGAAAGFPVDYADFYLAEALFRQDRYADAEAWYRRYLTRHEGPEMKALAHLHLGLVLEMQGRRPEALRFYQQVEAQREYDSDAAAARRAMQLQQAPLGEHRRALVLARNAHESRRYAVALQRLEQVFATPGVPAAERAEAAYRMGRIYQEQQRWAEALRFYQQARQHPGDPQAKWGPWSQYYIGEVYEAQGQQQEAKAAYTAALRWPGTFDYRQALEQRLRLALRRIS